MDFKNPYLLATMLQITLAGMILLSEAAYDHGMSVSVLVFYRQLLGTLVMIPFAISFEWKSIHSMDFRTFCKIFGIALIGITLVLNLYGYGLKFTTSTVGAATLNCAPVMTILFAVILRMEKVNLRKGVGIAKVLGVTLCTGGVAVLAFYSRSPRFKSPFEYHLFNMSHKTRHISSTSTWLKGCLLSLIAIASGSLSLVLQGKVLKSYPSKLIFTTVLCFSSAIQSFFTAIVIERDLSKFRLAWDFSLLVVIYCGTLAGGLSFYLQVLIINSRGPVFLAMSTPLSLIITMVCSMVLLSESITLASILGGLLLGASLYIVLLAKKCEEEEEEEPEKMAKPQTKSIPGLDSEINEETHV